MIENFKEGFDKFCKMLDEMSDEKFFEELKNVGIVFDNTSPCN